MYIEFLPPPSYKLVHVNHAVLKTFRESFFGIMGRPMLYYVEMSYKIPFTEWNEKVISNRLPNIFHTRIVPIGSPPVEVRAIHVPIFDDSGRVVRIGGHGRVVNTEVEEKFT